MTDGWKDIGTAPQNGETVELMLFDSGEVVKTFWNIPNDEWNDLLPGDVAFAWRLPS